MSEVETGVETRTETAALWERHQAVLPRWVTPYYREPIALSHGEGRHVWDVQGRRYLDFFGGILTTMTGHAVPEVVAAIREQAGRLLHSSTLYLIEQQVELAERIAVLSGIPDAKVFFCNSGTEANDAALLLATSYRRSHQILALRNSYHGRSFSALGITGNRAWSPTALSPLQVAYVHSGYRLRSPFRDLSDSDYIAACVDDLEDVLRVATSGQVAAMIAEPIQGVGGFATPPDGLLGAFQEVLRREGILLISDEVQTGWGRTGDHFWGWEAHGCVPDIVTFAKGVGNGMALAGVIARGEIMDSLPALSISTFGGNPLACSAALANLEVLLRDDLQRNSLERGRQLRSAIEAALADHPRVAEVRGRGLMLGIELLSERAAREGTLEADAELAGAVLEEARREALLIGKGGLHGNVLRVAPPLSVTAAEIDQGAESLVRSLRSAAG